MNLQDSGGVALAEMGIRNDKEELEQPESLQQGQEQKAPKILINSRDGGSSIGHQNLQVVWPSNVEAPSEQTFCLSEV